MELEQSYAVLESAAIKIDRGIPLFYPFDEMAEYNEQYKFLLINALILAMDLMKKDGLQAEGTVMLEKIRRAYT